MAISSETYTPHSPHSTDVCTLHRVKRAARGLLACTYSRASKRPPQQSQATFFSLLPATHALWCVVAGILPTLPIDQSARRKRDR